MKTREKINTKESQKKKYKAVSDLQKISRKEKRQEGK